MKQLATILCLGIIGFAQAQSTSKDVEIYERYENGELVEQRQSATENGVPIKDFDFEKAKREMQSKSAEMEKKMDDMKSRMEEKRREIEISMESRMKDMEKRMSDFEKRSEEMHKKMDKKLEKMESKGKEQQEQPAKVEQPVVGESTQNVKFT